MRIFGTTLLLLLIPAVSARTGEWHVAGRIECGDCHLQHASDQRDPSVEGPYSVLLRKNSVNELCLSCHDGTNTTAPDVQSPTPMYGSTAYGESAAGHLAAMSIDNPNGHSLGVPMTTPLQGTPLSVELNCTSCHAAHGNGNYRNLVLDPAGTGTEIGVVTGVNIIVGRVPDNPPTAAGSIAAYARENVGYIAGLSAWCVACHDQLALNSASSLEAHFNAHPSDVALNSYSALTHADPIHWVNGSGEGFAGPNGILRVPFQAPAALDFAASQTPQQSNEVTCMSCHKAHGSGNRKALLWPYLEGGDTYLSGCQQCHNK